MIGALSRWREGGRVEVYTAHEPPAPTADRIDRATEIVFVKDGFSWGAFLLGPLWLAANREWVGLAIYLLAAMALSSILKLLGAPLPAVILAFAALGLFLGFEAASLRRWSLSRAGWSELGTVSGRNAAECERRFFESWLPAQPVIAMRAAAAAPVTAGTAKGWRGRLGLGT
ncbi:MAG: DUF2628 domain-containing protein [Hyphomicrobium sp.]